MQQKVPVLKSVHRLPVNGWFYEEGEYIFKSEESDSYKAISDLIDQVKQYRKGVRLNYDNVRHEVMLQLADRDPDIFSWEDGEMIGNDKLTNELIRKAIDLYDYEIKYAIKGDREKRTKTCVGCPMNKPLPFDDLDYEQMVFHVTRGNAPCELGICAAMLHDNRITCVMEKIPAGRSRIDGCWVDKAKENHDRLSDGHQ